MTLPTDKELDAMYEAAVQKKNEAARLTDAVSDEKWKPGPQNSGLRERVETKEVLVPLMTQEDVETNTPAFGKQMVAIRVPDGVSLVSFKTLLSNAYALYVTTGSYTVEQLVARTNYSDGIVRRTITTPEFTQALRTRGVVPNATGLTEEQEKVLLILTDTTDNKTLTQKLKRAGISYAKYRAWCKNKAFKTYLDTVTDGLLNNNVDSLVQLERLANNGDLGAIKFKFALNGLYDPNKQNNIDIMALMGKMLEIISLHVKDPEALQGVAKDLGELAQELKLVER